MLLTMAASELGVLVGLVTVGGGDVSPALPDVVGPLLNALPAPLAAAFAVLWTRVQRLERDRDADRLERREDREADADRATKLGEAVAALREAVDTMRSIAGHVIRVDVPTSGVRP